MDMAWRRAVSDASVVERAWIGGPGSCQGEADGFRWVDPARREKKKEREEEEAPGREDAGEAERERRWSISGGVGNGCGIGGSPSLRNG